MCFARVIHFLLSCHLSTCCGARVCLQHRHSSDWLDLPECGLQYIAMVTGACAYGCGFFLLPGDKKNAGLLPIERHSFYSSRCTFLISDSMQHWCHRRSAVRAALVQSRADRCCGDWTDMADKPVTWTGPQIRPAAMNPESGPSALRPPDQNRGAQRDMGI